MPAMVGTAHIAPQGIAFRKMHGLGNDFVVLDQRSIELGLVPSLVRAIGDRHCGVGFDQLAAVHLGADTDIELMFWNADGSTAGACGNATRCIAGWIMAESGVRRLTLRTERGVLSARLRPDDVVEVDMGAPMLDWQDVPLRQQLDTAILPIEGTPAACSMGNPHCTFFVEDADAVDLAGWGGQIEHHPLFPERTNVQFVQVLSPDRARVRVWERGVGVTLASGSSSCAVLVNANRRGLMGRRATLVLDGGEIEITWADNDHVLMAGPTAHVFDGQLSPEWIEANT
ncbi:MAG: diaminopimelate epimerase [Paracoccaceae bacterium]